MTLAALLIFSSLFQPYMASQQDTFDFTYSMDAIYEYLLAEEERAAFDLLETSEERNRFLYQFWMKHDPTPDTREYNELMLLFERRVEMANLLYGFDDGWQTDRGKVLIFFGPPVEIRRSRFGPATGAKHEIWIYRQSVEDEEGVQLVFEDELDSGEFILRTGIVYPGMLSLDSQMPRLTGDGR